MISQKENKMKPTQIFQVVSAYSAAEGASINAGDAITWQ